MACEEHAPYHIFVCCLFVCTTFFHISHKGHDFRKTLIEHNMCILILSTTFSEIFLTVRKLQGNIILNNIGILVNYRLALSEFNVTWIFSTDLKKNTKLQIQWQSAQCEASCCCCCCCCSMRTEGQTDMHDESNIRFSKFCVSSWNHILYRNSPSRDSNRTHPEHKLDFYGNTNLSSLLLLLLLLLLSSSSSSPSLQHYFLSSCSQSTIVEYCK